MKKILVFKLFLFLCLTGLLLSSPSFLADYAVKINVNDDTDNNPVHSRAEIWIRGHGSWFLAPELKYGGTTKTFSGFKLDEKHEMFIYPDSRDGKEMKISFMLTKEMNPQGSVRDALIIDIDDESVTVKGLPIKAASGEFEIKIKR